MTNLEIPTKPKRKYLPEKLEFEWEKIKPYFEELKNREINSVKELEKWMKDLSEVEAVLEEEKAWRYIHMTINGNKPKLEETYMNFVNEIDPNIAPYSHEYNKKIIESKYAEELNKEKYYVYLRSVKKSIELYREENIPLLTELEKKSTEYRGIAGRMSIEHEGKKLTMEQAAKLLKETNRNLREEIYHKINNRRKEDEKKLDDLYTELIKLRHKVALNAGYKNYRDYKFDALGRFDYTPEDCKEFHKTIEKIIVPLTDKFDIERKEKLKLEKLKPWDMLVDPEGKQPLKPFENGEELLEKSIKAFNNIKPFFGERLQIMKEMKHLDLESKDGKAPGGYNYPLHEIGVPFIFMNAVGLHRDLETLMHEGGHAIHSFLTRNLELTELKDTPSEVAELASMSMELISMPQWKEFYNEEEHKRAMKEQLQGTLETLPWVAAVDSFQHWIYENPEHTVNERKNKWFETINTFGSQITDWKGQEENKKIMWQKQLHIFEVPFYYIEYAISQLGAIAMYKKYKENPEQAINNYEEFMKLGYTKTIPEIYKTAGIKFDFSKEYIKELTEFVKQEIKKLE